MAAGDTIITIVGNLTADPELRFTGQGKAVASFTVASTPRFMDRQTNQWTDGEPLFLRCNVWGKPGENAAESLQRGMRVIVQGRLKQRSFETKEGQKVTVFEVEVDEVAPSLKFATAKINRAARDSQGAPADDPWASASPAYGQQSAGVGAGSAEEPPF